MWIPACAPAWPRSSTGSMSSICGATSAPLRRALAAREGGNVFKPGNAGDPAAITVLVRGPGVARGRIAAFSTATSATGCRAKRQAGEVARVEVDRRRARLARDNAGPPPRLDRPAVRGVPAPLPRRHESRKGRPRRGRRIHPVQQRLTRPSGDAYSLQLLRARPARKTPARMLGRLYRAAIAGGEAQAGGTGTSISNETRSGAIRRNIQWDPKLKNNLRALRGRSVVYSPEQEPANFGQYRPFVRQYCYSPNDILREQ